MLKKRSVAFSVDCKMSFKIIIVGEQNVGKTSLVLRYVKDIFSKDYKVTVGFEFYSKIIKHDNQDITVQIWDTAGQQAFKSMIRAFYRNAACVFLMFSLAKADSFFALSRWIDEVKKQSSHEIILVLVGSKSDISGSEVIMDKIEDFKRTHGIDLYMEVSSKDNTNIEQLFKKSVEIMYNKYYKNAEFRSLVSPNKDSFILPQSQITEPKKSCCK